MSTALTLALLVVMTPPADADADYHRVARPVSETLAQWSGVAHPGGWSGALADVSVYGSDGSATDAGLFALLRASPVLWADGGLSMSFPVGRRSLGNLGLDGQYLLVDGPHHRLGLRAEVWLPTAVGRGGSLAHARDLPSVSPRTTTLGIGGHGAWGTSWLLLTGHLGANGHYSALANARGAFASVYGSASLSFPLSFGPILGRHVVVTPTCELDLFSVLGAIGGSGAQLRVIPKLVVGLVKRRTWTTHADGDGYVLTVGYERAIVGAGQTPVVGDGRVTVSLRWQFDLARAQYEATP